MNLPSKLRFYWGGDTEYRTGPTRAHTREQVNLIQLFTSTPGAPDGQSVQSHVTSFLVGACVNRHSEVPILGTNPSSSLAAKACSPRAADPHFTVDILICLNVYPGQTARYHALLEP